MKTYVLLLIAFLFCVVGVCVDIFIVKEFCEAAGVDYSWKMLFLYWFMKG